MQLPGSRPNPAWPTRVAWDRSPTTIADQRGLFPLVAYLRYSAVEARTTSTPRAAVVDLNAVLRAALGERPSAVLRRSQDAGTTRSNADRPADSVPGQAPVRSGIRRSSSANSAPMASRIRPTAQANASGGITCFTRSGHVLPILVSDQRVHPCHDHIPPRRMRHQARCPKPRRTRSVDTERGPRQVGGRLAGFAALVAHSDPGSAATPHPAVGWESAK